MLVDFTLVESRHVEAVAENMRDEDAAEVMASHGHTPARALNYAVRWSQPAITVLVDEEPVAIFGLFRATVLDETGCPWMLGTDKLYDCGPELLYWGREVVCRMMRKCERLENYVHVDNRRSIVWLKRLGFQFDEPRPHGVNDELFMRFSMEKSDV